FKGKRYYFQQTMRLDKGQVFVSPLDLNVERDESERPLKPMIRFATPVFDRQGAKKGIVILNYLGADLIRKLVEVSVTFPGTALLLNREGFVLHGPSADDEWGFMLGHDRTFAKLYPEARTRLSEAGQGQFHTGQGLFTFHTLAPRVPRDQKPGFSEKPGFSMNQDSDAADP